jgi:signal transduction histidine kinase
VNVAGRVGQTCAVEESRGLGVAVRRWRMPLAVAAAVAAAVVVALPFSGVAGPLLPGFTAAWCAVVLLCDLITVSLLVGLWRNGRGLRMLVLATAFGWSAIVVVLLALGVPGVVAVEPPIGMSFSDVDWLYVSRHLGPPMLIALALAPWPAGWEARANDDPHTNRWALASALAILVVGPGSLAVELTAFPSVLPSIVEEQTERMVPVVIGFLLVLNVLAVGVALLGVTRRGPRSGVEVWAIVAGFACLGDVTFMALHEDLYSVAYYGGRLLALTAAMIVPASILVETWLVHKRVMAGAQDLEEQVDRLLEAQRLRDHIAAVVSHDMRTPLAGLHGYLEVLVDDDDLDDELVRRMHERALVLTRRLTLLSEDLLAATTGAHNDLALNPGDLDLPGQLAECATGFPELDLRISCPAGLRVHADPLRLQQILSNLVRNAQKHGAEPVTIDVSATDAEVTLRVGDAGEGVPEAFIPRLFERYSQGARATGGAGIGLSVVHDLVQAHHGSIRYDLTDPAFIVTLPVGAPDQPLPEGRVLTAPARLRSTA